MGLNSPIGVATAVVSLKVVESSSGLSVEDLIQQIFQNIPALLRIKVWEQAVSTLGSDWMQSAGQLFDPYEAKSTIRVIDARTIPCISPDDCPVEVSSVRFSADVSSVQPFSQEYLLTCGPLFESISSIQSD